MTVRGLKSGGHAHPAPCGYATDVHPRMEWAIPAFTFQPQSIPAFISRQAVGRRLSWPGWMVTYTQVVRPSEAGHPS